MGEDSTYSNNKVKYIYDVLSVSNFNPCDDACRF